MVSAQYLEAVWEVSERDRSILDRSKGICSFAITMHKWIPNMDTGDTLYFYTFARTAASTLHLGPSTVSLARL